MSIHRKASVVQKSLNIAEEASFVINIKNPERESTKFSGLSEKKKPTSAKSCKKNLAAKSL
jgi:hypothetical protein